MTTAAAGQGRTDTRSVAGWLPIAPGGPRIPVRVMHIVHALQPGGMEFGVVKLVNGLDRTVVESSICSTTPASSEMTRLLSGDVPLFELARRPGNDPGVVRDLYRLLRRTRPHVVHSHAWGTLVEGMLAARLARVPFVVHGEHGTLQLRRYQKWLQRLAWGRADRVLSVSSRLAERMSRETGLRHDAIQTLRNGVDLSRFDMHSREEARRGLDLACDALVIGTAGRLVPVKDHRNLLGAMAQLRRRGLRPALLMAGDGPLRAELEAAAEALGIAEDVRWLGHHPQVERVLAAMDVFVLSSVSEGLSNTIIEAMASGLPVVATSVGGADELVVDGETGILVPPQSSEALADAIARLLEAPSQRVWMGRAARRRAESEFSLSAMICRYERMYLDLRGRSLLTLAPPSGQVL